MATFSKREGKRGTTWTARVRHRGACLTKTFRTKAAAQRWAATVEADKEGHFSRRATITLAGLIDEYAREILPTLRDKHRTAQLLWWRDRLGGVRVGELTADAIQEVLDAYRLGDAEGYAGRTRGRRSLGRPRKPATVNRMLAALSAVLTYATRPRLLAAGTRRKPYIDSNPCRLVERLPENNQRVRFLSDDERARLLAACKRSSWDQLYLLVVLATTTGARRGELLGLRWCDVDLANATLTFPHTKNGDARTTPLLPEVVDLLRPLRGIGEALVFPSTKDQRKPFAIERVWREAKQAAGLTDFRFHDLRHDAATTVITQGGTLEEAAQLLGHRNIQTTKRYAHLSTEAKRAVVQRVMKGRVL